MKNQLTHIQSGENTLRYLYDRQGNLLEERGKAERKQYAYDTANRQVSVASAGADGTMGRLLQSNRYDGEGLRYETEENGKVIRFLFDRSELAQENREDEKISYVRGHRAISLSRSGKDRNYFVQDEMGSTLFLLDQNHEIRKTYRYDAFGNILKETGDIPNRLTYTGQIYDSAAIQYYLRARFYNPVIGRFIQEDTYRGDGLNLYAYCANNPVIYFDPSGHDLCPMGLTQPGNAGSGEDSTGVLEGANYAQTTYSDTFSPQGRKIYSELAGEPINTIADLVNAIKSGKINVADIPVEYIIRDGNTLILNTRTSQALTQAGIPRSQWNAINRTGEELFETLLTGQLTRNNLTSEGISVVRPSGGRK